MTAALALVGESGHPSTEALAAQWDQDRWDLRLYGYTGYPPWVRYRGRRDVARRGATGISRSAGCWESPRSGPIVRRCAG